jgi:hypothetical protein
LRAIEHKFCYESSYIVFFSQVILEKEMNYSKELYNALKELIKPAINSVSQEDQSYLGFVYNTQTKQIDIHYLNPDDCIAIMSNNNSNTAIHNPRAFQDIFTEAVYVVSQDPPKQELNCILKETNWGSILIHTFFVRYCYLTYEFTFTIDNTPTTNEDGTTPDTHGSTVNLLDYTISSKDQKWFFDFKEKLWFNCNKIEALDVNSIIDGKIFNPIK